MATNNLGTPYDYKSVMHYSRYMHMWTDPRLIFISHVARRSNAAVCPPQRFAFSKNGSPTILAKSDPSIALGSNQMSNNDIERINKLYDCCE